MIGFVLAVAGGALGYFLWGQPFEEAFRLATKVFLFWHLGWSMFGAFLIGFIAVGIVSSSTICGWVAGGPLGGLLGATIGGGITGLFVVIALLKTVMLVGGAYLLHTSVFLSGGEYIWNIPMMVVGIALVVVSFSFRVR